MKKVFVLAPKEDWIVDRFVKEWNEDNPDISVTDPNAADAIWLLADWAWTQVPRSALYGKKVLATVHHLVPDKFGPRERMEFEFRDRFITAYHVPNKHTEDFVKTMTQKPIHVIPYWANQKIWRLTGMKGDLRKKHKLPEAGYLVGSFQRDTEGHDLKSPKLEKGPDLLADALEKFSKQMPNLHVVLGGWRRQYLIGRLEAAGIPYNYFEKPNQFVINELYQTLDLYPVTARQEGGPQSLIECGLLGIPVVSRDVGMATSLLPPTACNNDIIECYPAVPNVEHLKLPAGYEPYRRLIESL
jgi:glycosyltransferase involved in cell wall biosynthesis